MNRPTRTSESEAGNTSYAHTLTRKRFAAAQLKRHIVFVHGFNDKAEDCWGEMCDRLKRDATISQMFEYDLFEYDTAMRRVALLKRLPSLDEIGAELVAYLDRTLVDSTSCQDNYIDTTLVGHSMGGLVIQSCLVQLLNSGRGRELDRLRQAILFATPNFGSDLLNVFRRLLAPIFPNPQEEALRTFSEQAMHIHHTVRERIIDARSRGTMIIHCQCTVSGATRTTLFRSGRRGVLSSRRTFKGRSFKLTQAWSVLG